MLLVGTIKSYLYGPFHSRKGSEMDAVNEQEGPKADVWKIMTNKLFQLSLLSTYHLLQGHKTALLNNSLAFNLIIFLKMPPNEDMELNESCRRVEENIEIG